ncbi:MAG: glycosyltransferase family A protein, partial [Chloroflexota bacterium]|nr:glycosyltransferase family A protein [Chloroflexota bacterium]
MKATILITVYNSGAYLERALRSALSQSLGRSAYEVVVVDDGSTDNTPEVLKKFGKEIVAVRQSNMGLAAACNTGIKAAQGEYLVRLDADDELEHNAVEALATALDNHPECALAFADRTEIDVPSHTERVKRLEGR